MKSETSIKPQFDTVDFAPVTSFGPFVLKSDYIRKVADLTSTVMVQDNVIERLERQLRQTEMRLETILAKQEHDAKA